MPALSERAVVAVAAVHTREWRALIRDVTKNRAAVPVVTVGL